MIYIGDSNGEWWPSKRVLRDLPPGEIAALKQAGRDEIVAAHENVVRLSEASDEVRVLLAGSVKVYVARQVDGEIGEDILSILGAGELLGDLSAPESSALDGQSPPFAVATLQPCRLLRFRNADFHRLLRASPVLSWNLHLNMAQRLRRLTLRAHALNTLDVPGRVAWNILSLSDEFGVPQPNGDVTIELPLTQKEIADLVAATRQNVNIALMQFRHIGAISIARKTHHITVHNRAALQKRCR